jgi:hypothetical protein
MAHLSELGSVLAAQPPDHAGVRLSAIPELRPFLNPGGPVGHIPALVLGPECLPVRAILFDKSAEQNWSLGWHQDRTIAVRQRIDMDGFGPWSIKSGMVHVEPPFDLLARMVTMRVHLDPVPTTNAPLLVAPGSHKRGRIPTAETPDVVRQCGVNSMSGRSWGRLALCDAHSSRVRSRRRGVTPPSATGRLCRGPASRRVAMARYLSRTRERRVLL